MTNQKLFCLLIFSLALIPATLFSGDIDPPFVLKLNSASPGSKIPAIVFMREQADINSLDAELTAKRVNFKTRHAEVLKELQANTRDTQYDILRFLELKQASGEVDGYRSFWISNIVSVTATPEVLRDLSQRFDVARVYEDEIVHLEDAEAFVPASEKLTAGIEPNLIAIKADKLWEQGITGKGVIVCSLDSGVDAAHPALADRWKGNNGAPVGESWFDPHKDSSFPVDDASNKHGSHVMGIMAGRTDTDTVGVAIDAQWISANTFERGASTESIVIRSFQWAADPDGNPETVSDVPDVINNSWGLEPTGGSTTGTCTDIFDAVIAAAEAAGSIVIFSAGNSGSAPMTVFAPASSIVDPVTNFAVGAVDQSFEQVASLSSRGPSPCDSVTIKPEVVAPGIGIRSVGGNGGFATNSGTSFSAPHVSGAAALLRNYNPSLTVRQIKTALLETARDLGPTGEDNDYGHGIINVKAAMESLPQSNRPQVVVTRVSFQGDENQQADPGDTLDLVLTLVSQGASASNVSAQLSSSNPLVTVNKADASFGNILRNGESANSGDPFSVALGVQILDGSSVSFVLDITGNGGSYQERQAFSIGVGDVQVLSFADHDIGSVKFTVTNFGRFGWETDSRNVSNGSGFQYPNGGTNWLFEGALLIGTSQDRVSDGARNSSGTQDFDFSVAPGGNLQITDRNSISDQDGFAVFDDKSAAVPLGVKVNQRSFSYARPPDNDYVIVEFTITNETSQLIRDMYVGLFFDWDLDSNTPATNNADYDAGLHLGYMWDDRFPIYVGLSVLDAAGAASYRVIDNQSQNINLQLQDDTKYEFLSGGFQVTSGRVGDWSQLLATGSFSLSPFESVTTAFAVLAGDDFQDLQANARAAKEKYNEIAQIAASSFTISVLQNPVFSDNVDIFVIPAVELQGAPVIMVNLQPVGVEEIIADDATIYVADHTLTSSGIINIAVSGVDLEGKPITQSKNFNASLFTAASGGMLTSVDGLVTLTADVGTVLKDTYFLIDLDDARSQDQIQSLNSALKSKEIDGRFSNHGSDLYSSSSNQSETYIVQPQSLELRKRSKLVFSLKESQLVGEELEALGIYRWNGASWVYQESYLSETKETITAFVKELGTYRLMTVLKAGSPILPSAFSLSQNYPNPFNPSTTINFTVPAVEEGERSLKSPVTLNIYNIRGQLVRTLVDGKKEPGFYSAHWDGTDDRGNKVASGIYIYRLNVESFSDSKKMLVLK